MRKLSLFMVMLLLSLSILTILPTNLSYANTSRVTVTDDYLRVRTGPGTEYRIIGSTNTGDSHVYLGSENDSKGDVWYKIQFTSSSVGYIYSAYAKLSSPSAPAAPTVAGTVTVNAQPYLNVRDGAGTNYRVIGSLHDGAKAEYYSLSNGWYQIKYGSGIGYISATYASSAAQPAPAPAPTPTPPPASTITGKIKTTADVGLNVRTQPNTSSVVLGTVPLGTILEYYKLSNGWYEVNYKSQRAYVSADWVQIVSSPSPEPTPTPAPVPTVIGKLKTTATVGLNVRSKPSTSSTILGLLAMGTEVEYYSLSNGWYQIKFRNSTAYISSTWATVISAPAPAPQPKPEPKPEPKPQPVVQGKVSVTAGVGLNVRALPNTTSSILGVLSFGTTMDHYGLKDGWYEIRFNGKVAFISATYAQEIKPAPAPTPKPEPEPEPEPTPLPVTSVNLAVFPVSSVYKLSVPIVITARGAGPEAQDIAYRFSLTNRDTGQVIMTQEYSVDDALIWTPELAGSYSVTIEAKNIVADKTQATSNVFLEVENAQGALHSYSIDFYGKTLDQAVLDQLAVSGRAVTDASGRWIQATKDQVMAAMNPANYIPFDYEKDAPDLGFVTVLFDSLNVRPFARAYGEPLGSVNRGEQFNVVDIFNDWYQIDYNGNQGWVSGSFVSYTPVDDQTTPEYALVELSDIPREMYQFLDLRYYTGLTSSTLNSILVGKGILEGQGSAFVEASQSAGINEAYLVAHAFLETGHGRSQLANGFWYNPQTDDILAYGSSAKPGYVKVYNMFGIGAIDSNPIGGGVRYAYNEGWTTPYKAIVGGAQWIGASYINSETREQYTLYTMKYNMYDNAYQYATDVGWAVKQTNQMYNIYSQTRNFSFRFVLPQYRASDELN